MSVLKVVQPDDLDVQFELGTRVANKVTVRLATQAVDGTVRLATNADVVAGTAGVPVDAAQLKAVIQALPADKYLSGLASYNAATNVMTLNMSDGSTVNVDMTGLVADALNTAIANATVEIQDTFGNHIGFMFP